MDALIALLRVLASMIVVTVLAYYGTRWLGRQAHRAGSSNTLRMETSLSLGGRRYVSIVEADGRRFLIGMTDQQVGLIAELEQLDQAGEESTGKAGRA